MTYTAPQLFALALGKTLDDGGQSCFYCGCNCSGEYTVRDYRAKTFADWGSSACPESTAVCRGCVECLDEKREMSGREKMQKTRMYSWLVSRTMAAPMTKAHIDLIRAALFDPPLPPWFLSIATSGQKHLIFRTPVNLFIQPPWSVSLETEVVTYTPVSLYNRLTLCKQIAAAYGKPSLSCEMSAGMAVAIAKRYGCEYSEPLIEEWSTVASEPLSRLAGFICPPKEICAHELPTHDPTAIAVS